MAHIDVSGEELHVRLGLWDTVRSMKHSLHVPLGHVDGVALRPPAPLSDRHLFRDHLDRT